MSTFTIDANGSDMGCYVADTAAQALDAYARDAGYTDYADVVKQFGDDAEAIEIDTDGSLERNRPCRVSGLIREWSGLDRQRKLR